MRERLICEQLRHLGNCLLKIAKVKTTCMMISDHIRVGLEWVFLVGDKVANAELLQTNLRVKLVKSLIGIGKAACPTHACQNGNQTVLCCVARLAQAPRLFIVCEACVCIQQRGRWWPQCMCY